MQHTTVLDRPATELAAVEGMRPFCLVRQEKIPLLRDGIYVTAQIGIRYAGYWRAVSAADGTPMPDAPEDALSYGLMKGMFALTPSGSLDFAPLVTDQLPAWICAANEALADAESPVRLETVDVGYMDYCVHEAPPASRYSGFIMGQMGGMRQIAVHEKRGIPGEWQCVCGEWNVPGEKCGKCAAVRPGLGR